jgi:hypothetical protein
LARGLAMSAEALAASETALDGRRLVVQRRIK